MNKFILILTTVLLTSASVFALEIKVNNLNIGLLDGHGRITTDKVLLKNKYFLIDTERNDLSINQTDNTLIVNHRESNANITILSVDKQVAFLKYLKEITIANSNISLNKSLNIWSSQVALKINNDNITFENTNFNCPTVNDDIINSCLSSSSSSIDQLSLPETMIKPIVNGFFNVKELAILKQAQSLNALKVKDFIVGFNKNYFDGSAAIKVIFDIKFTFTGKVDLAANKDQLIISELEIKKGSIPLTSVILETIKKADIQGITIKDGSVYIDL